MFFCMRVKVILKSMEVKVVLSRIVLRILLNGK